jgi:hypothetical protein
MKTLSASTLTIVTTPTLLTLAQRTMWRWCSAARQARDKHPPEDRLRAGSRPRDPSDHRSDPIRNRRGPADRRVAAGLCRRSQLLCTSLLLAVVRRIAPRSDGFSELRRPSWPRSTRRTVVSKRRPDEASVQANGRHPAGHSLQPVEILVRSKRRYSGVVCANKQSSRFMPRPERAEPSDCGRLRNNSSPVLLDRGADVRQQRPEAAEVDG